MGAELAAWAPPGVLAAVLLLALAALWHVFAKRFDKMESTLETVKERLPTLATVEQLGRMGDRFDARNTEINRELGSIRERIAKLEPK
jgi:hypothetical protein